MSAQSTLITLGLTIIFVCLFARRSLWHTDLWDHINYGRFIAQFGVPETEPLLKIAKGTPFVSTAWMSQVGMATIADTPVLGLPALQFAHALLVIIGCAAVGLAVFRKTRSGIFTVIAYSTFVAVDWQQLIVIRPQLAGVAGFCLTYAALQTGMLKHQSGKAGLAFLYLLWANCHGSFAMGLTLMALTSAGQLLDALIKTKSVAASLKTQPWKSTAVALVLCTSMAAINPFGVRIFEEVLRVGQHPNIATMFEWDRMTLQMKQGRAMAAATIILLTLLCCSPRRIRMQEILPLLATAGLALWSSRMINWYSPLVAGGIGIHGAAVCCRFTNRRITTPRFRSKIWTIINVALLATAIGGSSLGTQTMVGKPAEQWRLVSAATPVNVTEFLMTAEDLPDGLTLATAEWAGYLMYHVGDQVRPFANLHVHVIPPTAWQEYIRMIRGSSGWHDRLKRHDINTVVVDKRRYPKLAGLASRNGTFKLVFEDPQAAVYVRSNAGPAK